MTGMLITDNSTHSTKKLLTKPTSLKVRNDTQYKLGNRILEKPLKMVTGPNTVSWKRDYSYPEMLVNFVSGNLCSTYNRPMTSRDVCVVNDLFCMQNDLSIYNLLLEEIQSCGIDHEKLFKLWHGNTRGDPGTHLIVRDCNRTGIHKRFRVKLQL